jgi:hypothetical protein
MMDRRPLIIIGIISPAEPTVPAGSGAYDGLDRKISGKITLKYLAFTNASLQKGRA